MEFLPILLIFGLLMIPMLLMSNRQRKMQRERQAVVNALGVGDDVRTHSGFYGLIVEADEEIVILETESGAQTKWARAAIAMKVESEDVLGSEGTADAGEADSFDEDSRFGTSTFEDRKQEESSASSTSEGDIFGSSPKNDR